MSRSLAAALAVTDVAFLVYWTVAAASQAGLTHISLVLTQVAGLMAVGYWALLGEFDPAWFLPNLALVVWPMLFLPALVCELGRRA